ncbi:MAG: cadherin-like beta sandwich domain-containing protein, partial [Chloroflexi bacterium]|nr:cadherin-like beta sandwich domain-containing protein [Chloroflexota bacterium]
YMASVANGVMSVVVTPTRSDANATYTVSNAAGACAADACALDVGANVITVTVTAEAGVATRDYVVTVTRAVAPTATPTAIPTATPTTGMLAIDNVWPKTGVPEGGMPVSLFGSGFTGAYSVTVGGKPVDFEVLSDGRIDITAVPSGTNGTYVDFVVTAPEGSATAAHAYQYIAYSTGSAPAMGGVITTASGATITVPALGYTFVLTYTPLSPPIPPLGNVLMYVFRLDAELNWVPVSDISQPITIELPVDPSIVPNGERPWLYVFVPIADRRPPTTDRRMDDGRRMMDDGGRTTAVGGQWTLVPGQTYDPATMRLTVQLSRMKTYALSTLLLYQLYVPQAGRPSHTLR